MDLKWLIIITILIILSLIILFIFLTSNNNSSVTHEEKCPEEKDAKILYSYGLFSCDPMPEKMKKNIKHNKNVTQLEYYILGQEEVDEDLKIVENVVPGITNSYHRIPRGVGKSDLARMVSLYVMGGHYADLDVAFHHKPSVKTNAVTLYTESFSFTDKHSTRIANYALSAPKEHPFILAVIKEIVNRINKNSKQNWSDRDVLFTTGPDVITCVYHEQKHLWNKINCKVILLDYWTSHSILVHKCMGSWRNKKDNKDNEVIDHSDHSDHNEDYNHYDHNNSDEDYNHDDVDDDYNHSDHNE